MTFTDEQFRLFKKTIDSLNVSNYTCYHPEGFKAILRSEQYPGCIGFTYQEVNQIKKMFIDSMMTEQIQDALNC